MAKTGPKGPRTEVDWEDFEKLCEFHCTQIEIAEFFKMSVDTLARHVKRHYHENFAEVFKKKSSKGRVSLRRKMYEMAMGGDRVMCIWLSKQILGYTEKVEQRMDASVSAEKTVVILPENGREAKELE